MTTKFYKKTAIFGDFTLFFFDSFFFFSRFLSSDFDRFFDFDLELDRDFIGYRLLLFLKSMTKKWARNNQDLERRRDEDLFFDFERERDLLE